MGHRLSNIVTRTGDDGTTGRGHGPPVAREVSCIGATGAVDECYAAVGLLLVEMQPDPMAACLTDVQHDVFGHKDRGAAAS
jgi:cob(I)alamin adenosyltransferase